MSSRRICRFALLGILASCLAGCAAVPRPNQSTATIDITGTPGSAFTGYVIRDNQRLPLVGTIPSNLTQAGVVELAVRKVDPSAAMAVYVRTTDASAGGQTLAGDANGIRVMMANGLQVRVVTPEEDLSPPRKDIFALVPYWHGDTWVFDDPRAGLEGELFVRGSPEIIDVIGQNIPNARAGFKLTCSGRPFDGYQKRLHWVREEDGGNVYALDGTALEGWLCAALFRYFEKAPTQMYVRADPK